jgi:Flp pilus assembly protein TadG
MFRNGNKWRKGTALMLGTAAMVFVVPMIGLAVDVGILYAVKAHLQATVDGASLAAARALSLGASTAAQASSAKQNAVNWFYANFPSGSWETTNVQMDTSDAHVNVYDDPANPNLRHVDVIASLNVPTYFMKWFGANATTISATGFATRRDVNAMLVLDRSGSMCSPSSAPCNSSNANCGALINSAKTFNGQFAAGRDKIGAISFASGAYLHSAPTTNFQTTLGYSNSFGSATGELDTIVCNGGTGSVNAFSLAYNELYKINQPGALNLIVFETDGKANELALNFWDGTSAGVLSTSNCKDANNKTKSAGGFNTLASLPSWTSGYSMNSGGAGYVPNIPAGIVGELGGYDSGSNIGILFKPWITTRGTGSDPYGESSSIYVTSSAAAPGCAFLSNHTSNSDIAWLPTTDIYGNNLINASYNSVSTSGGHVSPVTMAQIRAASLNALDNASYRARTNTNLPVYIFTVGFTSLVDNVILQRMANDPSWLPNSSCTSTGKCVNYTNQPQGTYVFAANNSQLLSAFLSLSSQILRLSQ